MALTITEECINCGACEPDCPNEAISEGEEYYEVDPEQCTECVGFFEDPKCIEVCPVECIVPHTDYQESREELLAKKQRLHPN